MPSLQKFRAGKPAFYPDQTIYAEFACATFGLRFEELDKGTGLVFRVSSAGDSVCFSAGRGSFYPQNSATAATLAGDKYFAQVALDRAGLPTLGGQYFFLHERHRAHRPPGHERADVVACFRQLGGVAFLKPLAGSRGDFAQTIDTESGLADYLDEVARYYDAVLLQPVVSGREYRIFVLDDRILYSARKLPPSLVGDGTHAISELLADHDIALQSRGLSPVTLGQPESGDSDVVLPAGSRRDIPGRMNRSAGGSMLFEAPGAERAAFALATQAVRALGLRAAAVDMFTDVAGEADNIRIIEVNANPSIRFLEDSDRADLILAIWQHTFAATGLLGV
ncbi:ATP-grasp domain-containing protein [Rhodopseudomonas sp. P2A-2r]|uniref:ATP-grasp domain-containing protein n=1 Tax=unclassified Rhodopseudomonas TaxID=2638247 RepID=UPI002234407A|nr:hypothetical protein [Rhodopseudomonas sp. P2A-2r]UZE49028.1 hypothetical protein ONR75_30680 [Rhodopseudomonas sp. P2A-2r]